MYDPGKVVSDWHKLLFGVLCYWENVLKYTTEENEGKKRVTGNKKQTSALEKGIETISYTIKI